MPVGAFVYLGLHVDDPDTPAVSVMAACHVHAEAVGQRAETYAISAGVWAPAECVVEVVQDLLATLDAEGIPHSGDVLQATA